MYCYLSRCSVTLCCVSRCRYKLLLDDLLQNTPSDHADLHALQGKASPLFPFYGHNNVFLFIMCKKYCKL